MLNKVLIFAAALCLSCGLEPQQSQTVTSVMDDVVTRLYEVVDETKFNTIDTKFMLNFITPQERSILATKYWTFDVNVPAVVSVMRHQDQAVVPFWLAESGFEKIDGIVANEEYTYEIWQKKFKAGTVELGINGFDKHRPHYFVAVGPQDKNDELTLNNFYPQSRHIEKMEVGAFTYHDWDELVITQLPEELRGQQLLTTIRGRAREAHVINAFRKTDFPSSATPDQILLTWSDDPQTTQSFQWRTNTSVKKSVVHYWPTGDSTNFTEISGERAVLEDRLLYNDRYIHRFTVTASNLEPGKKYKFKIGSIEEDLWSETGTFKTAPESPAPFSFIYFGDTHYSNYWGKLVNSAHNNHPETAFYTIAGDIVSTGLYRNEWDQLFDISADVFDDRPLMPSLGNHDNQDGLGAGMFLDLFHLPHNGPECIEKERAYSFEYSNALFLILDATGPIEEQAKWLEAELKKADADWKFAVFHFPPYSYEEDYPSIRKHWGSLFDEYHVDMVMSGHVHYYMRSKPMYAGTPVASPADGTIYLISISIPNRNREMPPREWVDVRFGGEGLYQTFDIDNKKLVYRSLNIKGEVKDELVVEK